MNCFKCGEPVPETDKLWESTGMCEACRIKEQAKDEASFWENKVLTQIDELLKEVKEINITLKEDLQWIKEELSRIR